MPYGGHPTRTALSLLLSFTFSPWSKERCRLITLQPAIPSGKSICSHCLSSHLHGFTGFFKPKASATAAKDSPAHHICSSAFFLATLQNFSWPHVHSSAYWSLSIPHSASLPDCPHPYTPLCLLPHFTRSYNLVPFSLDPVTLHNNDQMPSMSATSNFSSPPKHYVPMNPAPALPTPPGVSNESTTIYRLPGFILAICYPSRYFYCTSGCAISASETARWGGAENWNKGKR